MKKILFDLETNGLLDTVDTIWIAVCKDLNSGMIKTFSDHDKDSTPLNMFKSYLDTADILLGHNIISYDLCVLQKLMNYKVKPGVKIIDTMIVSQLNSYRRPGMHSLKNWGKILKDPKGESPDFMKFSTEMKTYAIQDVNLNHKVYDYLKLETADLVSNRPMYKDALRLEHETAKICSQQVMNKWAFDVKLAEKHYTFLTSEMKVIEDEVNPMLKERIIEIDTEDKSPKYLRDGRFQVTTARMLSQFFNKHVSQDDTHIVKPNFKFRRTENVPADLGNMTQVREMLLEQGWKPTQFTPKGEPKITEDSLGSVESDIGKKVVKYYSLRSRHSVLKGWIELAQMNKDKVYVEPFNLGTPTSRQRHSKVVNVPGVKSFFGKEMRELFIAEQGKVLVGCDSSGNQIRALAHYLNNKDVNAHILNGDIHQHNADTIGISRALAKGVLYATIFGAGMLKVGKMITGTEDLDVGRNAKNKLYEALPGLKELTKRLNAFFYSAEHNGGYGFIPALDGRKVFAESSFKCLNYLLQAFEAITVKSALVNSFEMFKKEDLNVEMIAMVHDEVIVQCSPKDSKRVSEILEISFGEFLVKKLKLNISMEGKAKIGKSWFEIH